MGTRFRVVAVALVLGCAATGCASQARPVDLAAVSSAQRPSPANAAGAESVAPSGNAPATCDPTAVSLRPNGLPSASQFPVGSKLAEIRDRGLLRAGVDQNTYLFGFRNLTSNQLEGFDIDRVRELAKAILGDPDKVQFKVITSSEREDALINDEVDVVARTYSVTCERAEKVNFSAIYYTAGQRVLVARDSPVQSVVDLEGKPVCATKGSTSIKKLASLPAKPVLVSVDNWSDCLIMLQQGQVAATSTDDTILAGMVKQDPNVKMVGEQITAEPYGIGVKKGDDGFVRYVNAVLDRSIKDGSWQASYDKWLQGTGDVQPRPTLKYRD